MLQHALEQSDGTTCLGHFYPDNVPARWLRDARAARKSLGNHLARGIHMRLEAAAELAQGTLVTARLEKLRDGQLGELVLPPTGHELEYAHAIGPAGGLNPARLEPGRHRLRERAAQHHVACAVERLCRARGLGPETKVGVDMVLNQGNVRQGALPAVSSPLPTSKTPAGWRH